MHSFNSEHYVETDFRKQANKNKLKEVLLLSCILMLERTSSSILRNLHFHRKLGLLSSWFIPSYQRIQLSPAQFLRYNRLPKWAGLTPNSNWKIISPRGSQECSQPNIPPAPFFLLLLQQSFYTVAFIFYFFFSLCPKERRNWKKL